MRRILILGGTTEARRLAEGLARRHDLAVTLSLAGRTAHPVAQPVPVRIGGFGGAQGLADYLAAERIDALIDATHPYAAIIAANAARAAGAAGVPLLGLRRPPWMAVAGDRWIEVDDVAAAVRALGEAPRRVFLALGRNEIAAFETAPQHRRGFAGSFANFGSTAGMLLAAAVAAGFAVADVVAGAGAAAGALGAAAGTAAA